MMDVRKIRCTVPCQVETAEGGCHCAEARNEITRLRTALEQIVKPGGADDFWQCYDIARAALERK